MNPFNLPKIPILPLNCFMVTKFCFSLLSYRYYKLYIEMIVLLKAIGFYQLNNIYIYIYIYIYITPQNLFPSNQVIVGIARQNENYCAALN